MKPRRIALQTGKPTDPDDNITRYFRDLNSLPDGGKSSEEEAALAARIEKGDDKAVKELVTANLRFVVSVARNYENQGIALGDLINIGNMGLIAAAKRFDRKKNFKFISYAVWWIRQGILQALAKQSRITKLPPNRSALIHRVRKASIRLEQELHRRPNAYEIAEALDLSPQEVRDSFTDDCTKLSIDSESPQSGRRFSEVFPDAGSPRPDEEAADNMNRRAVERVLSSLPEREQKILLMYYGFYDSHEFTLEEIGQEMGMTRERVRQIKEKACKVLSADPIMRDLRKSL